METGQIIRDYRIIKKLGEGGMGEVYLADDLMLERKVAVKILNPSLTKDPQFIQRFRQEAKVQSALHHPNIIILYTFFEEHGRYCMVIEFAEGETLKEIIKKNGPLPENRIKKIFGQLMDGMNYAHSKGVVHRDIKPGNLMIDKEDNLRIMDFGIAKIMGDMNITKTGMKLGTVYYMSPEQIRAEKDIDQRTDIYSAGITLYEMLTGKVPFRIDTQSEFILMKEIVECELKDPREIYPYIDKNWVDLITKMTSKEKEKRISDYKKITEYCSEKDTIVEQDKSVREEQTEKINRTDAIEEKRYDCPICSFKLQGFHSYCSNCGYEFGNTIKQPQLSTRDYDTKGIGQIEVDGRSAGIAISLILLAIIMMLIVLGK